MWHLVKAELKYNWTSFIAPVFLLFLFHVIAIFILSAKNMESNIPTKAVVIEFWFALYSFILFVSIFPIWSLRFKEKRARYLALLPISNTRLAFGRFWFAVIPFFAIMFYITLIDIISSSIFSLSESNLWRQVSMPFISVAVYLLLRDFWVSINNKTIKYITIFFAVLVISFINYMISLTLPKLYVLFEPLLDENIYFVKNVFFLWGLVILIMTIPSFIKRNNYLS